MPRLGTAQSQFFFMSAHMYNLEVELPDIFVVCSVCINFQECLSLINSVEVRFCLVGWPAIMCEACCSCRTCIYAYIIKIAEACTYKEMMDMAVHNYLVMIVEQFDGLHSKDLEVCYIYIYL